MAGFLDHYGTGDARREKLFRRIALGAVVALILGLVLYFQFRNYREEQLIKQFLAYIQERNFSKAYELWGCSEANPCREYAFHRFMEDWGPEGAYGSRISSAKVKETKSCSAGIIQIIEFQGNQDAMLWVERSTKTLGFAPFPICNPRMQVP
jgi:hypothetical protein